MDRLCAGLAAGECRGAVATSNTVTTALASPAVSEVAEREHRDHPQGEPQTLSAERSMTLEQLQQMALVNNPTPVRRLSKLTLKETDQRDGKTIRVKRWMIDPANVNTINTIVTESLTGDSELLVATKQ
jgi:hypothetical protein